MSNAVKEYMERVIGEGDKGSKTLASICARSLGNNEFVDVINSGMNGLAVLRVPKGNLVVVHSVGGDSEIRHLGPYVESAADKLHDSAKKIGAKLIGVADVVDANTIDESTLKVVGTTLLNRMNEYGVPILNGELAGLGNRINPEYGANVTLTGVSVVRAGGKINPGIFEHDGITYAAFNPYGKAVWINSDGIGTKTEFYERAEKHELGYDDGFAMKADDTVKLGANLRVISDVVEIRGDIPFNRIAERARIIGSRLGVMGIVQKEDVEGRIEGYTTWNSAYNISGSAVSTIDEEVLKNLPHPNSGEFLVAIRGRPNPRSNGISAKRKLMIKLFGNNWHKTDEGKIFLQFLASPSTILYPVFSSLMQKGLASSVYHLSGGAYNGKLAKPLAKHGLYVDMGDRLFEPDWREVALAAYANVRDSYATWPMGTDGFITTSKPGEALIMIGNHGLEGKIVGTLEAGDIRTGVSLVGYNGERIQFSGN